MTSERIKAVGESTPPLSIGFDIAIAMCRRADVLGHPYPSPELRVWLANQITIAVNAARLSSPTPDGVIKERGEDGEAERALRDGLSQVEPASGLNPSDFDPSRICPNPVLYDSGNCCGGACTNSEQVGCLADLGYPVDMRGGEPQDDPDAGLTHEQIAAEISNLAKGGTNITGTVLGALNRAYRRGLERRR